MRIPAQSPEPLRRHVVWLVLGFLLLALLLSVLQWRWLREVYWYELGRQQRTLETSTSALQRALEQELGSLAAILTVELEFEDRSATPRAEPLHEGRRRWLASARWPDLLEELYFVAVGETAGVEAVHRLGADGGWQAMGESEVAEIEAMAQQADVWDLADWSRRGPSLHRDPLAVSRRLGGNMGDSAGVLVMVVGRDVLLGRIVPQLTSWILHPHEFGDHVDVLLWEREERHTVYRSRPDLEVDRFREGAMVVGLFADRGSPRLASELRASTPDGLEEAYGYWAERPVDGQWLLFVATGERPLPRGVAGLRRWEILIGFLALALLGVTFAGVVSAARASHRIARRQADLLARVAHELRTPVAVLSAAGDNLYDGVASGPEQVARYGERIRAEAQRLAQIIDNTLRYGAAGRGAPSGFERFDLREVVHSVVDGARVRGERCRLEVETVLPAAPLWILADRGAMRAALANLVDNAEKQSEPGQRIRVEVGRRDDLAVLQVRDQGSGLAASEAESVWLPYRRGRDEASRDRRGIGLGLAVVREVAKRHRGSARFVSTAPGDVVVELTVPLAEADA